ncbi:MAG: HTTM domain-containing protein, partial [Vicingaceae bacterium]|nr:HTTM domain-containing protein [Vicingaceae bacterium]
IILILDLIFFRFLNIEAFYTDNGILPRTLAEKIGNSDGYTALTPISPLFISGSKQFVALFFILAGLSYTALLVGFKTRLASILSFFFLMSIQHRASIVVETDDRMLLCLVFWGIFLPLNHYFSVDNKQSDFQKLRISKMASFAFLMQISLIYFFNGFPKTGETWTTGIAMKYAMMEDLWINASTANWISQFDNLCYIITKITGPFEILLALLILTPMFWTKIRTVVVVSILLFHWGIAIFLSFGFLPLITTAWAIAMIPKGFWERYNWKPLPIQNSPHYPYNIIKSGLIGLLIFICSWQSATHTPWLFQLNSFLATNIANTALFDQGWLLYAPDANKEVGWIQVFGTKPDGSFVEIHSRKEWNIDGSLIPYYQQECWQNFVQYQMYYQPFYKEVSNSWLNWEVKKAKEDGIIITSGGIIHYIHTIQSDGSLTQVVNRPLYTQSYQ